ncbi:MAG: nuclear transport factor 2 family protein [Chitinophagaceae bacterium]|nr:nuclear transport factor 2 family protein [Chitinophagaceae bacterium]
MKLKYSLEIICFAVLILIVGCENSNHTQSNTPVGIVWSGIPGDPNFHCADRIAIKNVMEAYSLYWDNSDVERFFKLFTEDAVRIESMDGQKDVFIPMQERKAIVSERLNYFKSRGLQRRHLMANTHFLQQNDSSAHIKQYTLLTSTENEKELKLLSTIVYDVWLRKADGIWKISKYKMDLDGELDIPIKSSSNSKE